MKTKETKWHIMFFIIIILQIFPLIYMVSISLKDMEQIFSEPLKLIPSLPTLENYKYILMNVPIFKYIWNTFFIIITCLYNFCNIYLLANFEYFLFEFF